MAAPPDVVARVEGRLEQTIQVEGRPAVAHTLMEEMAAHHVPAVTVAVVDGGRIAWAKAYGMADVAKGRRATPRAAFQAGSISKPVAASAAMQLVQEGRLSLDKPANAQLRSWRIPDSPLAAQHPVTLRELLSHTAGTTVQGFPGYAAGEAVPTVVQVLNGQPPANTKPVVIDAQPGSVWNYSGGGITIAQLMMSDAARRPFATLMQQRVLGPLGMRDSSYEQPLPPSRAVTAATGYLGNGAAIAGRFHTYPEAAAAGLWTTPTDLARWIIALEQAYAGKSDRLMSRATAKAMLTEGLGHWGLGVEVGGTGDDFHFTHGGDDAGFKAIFTAWPRGGRAIVVMSNGDDGTVVIREVMQAVAREYGWNGLEPRILVPAVLSPEQTAELVGSYGRGAAVISSDGGKLEVRYAGRRYEVLPLQGGAFVIDPAGARIDVKLDRGGDGRIRGVNAGGLALPKDR